LFYSVSLKHPDLHETFWFTKWKNNKELDLREDPDYADRITYHFSGNNCLLRISDLKLRDSAEYKFRIETNQHGGSYTGSPGVTLTVTDLQVLIQTKSWYSGSRWFEMLCSSRCVLPPSSYVWYKNGEIITGQGQQKYSDYLNTGESVSCAVGGHDLHFVFLPDAPKSVSVSMNPPEILEDSSVTLTCSCDANPAANYTWFKNNQGLLSGGPHLILPSVHRSDSRKYHCVAENELGKTASEYVSMNVEFQSDWKRSETTFKDGSESCSWYRKPHSSVESGCVFVVGAELAAQLFLEGAVGIDLTSARFQPLVFVGMGGAAADSAGFS
uniref:Ig-like domain-containing protein n=1 Tax=Oryzias melastigma TaxID=30732 RepID=A0A3B3DF02_ORYME